MINFAAGLVDPYTLPVRETKAITERVFGTIDRGRQALQYDTTAGLAEPAIGGARTSSRMEGKLAERHEPDGRRHHGHHRFAAGRCT